MRWWLSLALTTSLTMLAGCGGSAASSNPSPNTPAISSAGPAQFLYAAAAGSTGTVVSAFRIGADGALAPLGTALQTSVFTVIGAPDANGHHLFGLQGDSGSGGLVTFSVNPATGALQQTSSAALAANTQRVVQVVFNSSRTLMFVAVVTAPSGGALLTYSIDGSGNLALAHSTTLALAPGAIVINPSGSFLYLATLNSDQTTTFTQFSIDPTGALAPVATLNPALLGGTALAMTGNTLYWGTSTPPQIVIFSADAATGNLTQGTTVSCSCVAADTGLGILAGPKATLLFQGIQGQVASASGVLPYAVDQSTGSLSPLPGAFIPVSSAGPPSFLLDSSGAFLYATSIARDQIFAFSVTSSGTAPLPGSPYIQRTNGGMTVVNFIP